MKLRVLLIISLLALSILYCWQWVESNKTRVVFCDVGQGDGILISRGSAQMLFDVGPENNKMAECLGKYLPFWDKEIEVVIISHWDKDHSGGLGQIKKSYKVDRLLSNEQINYSDRISQNDIVRLGEINFEVVAPRVIEEDCSDDNFCSVVGILRMGKKVLLTGDAPTEVEQRLVWRGVINEEVDVLKVSHHGSETATSEELLELIKPKMAVISVGKNNKYGHPGKSVLERLAKFEVGVRRTDEEGDVVMEL